MYREEQKREFEFLGKLNSLSAVEYPADAALRARIKSYELAFRMQMAVPEAISFKEESEETKRTLRPRSGHHASPSGRSASPPAGCRSAACGSCRSTTAAAATPGTRTKI